jgi:CRP-like cAMP-binding protein
MQQPIEFEKGEYILREFEVADCAYVILQGDVGIFKRGAADEIIPLGIIKAGEYLGELGVVSGKTRSAEAIALTAVTVVKITKEILETELSKAPAWVSALLIGLAERLAKADELLKKHQTSDPALLQIIQPVVQLHLAQANKSKTA